MPKKRARPDAQRVDEAREEARRLIVNRDRLHARGAYFVALSTAERLLDQVFSVAETASVTERESALVQLRSARKAIKCAWEAVDDAPIISSTESVVEGLVCEQAHADRAAFSGETVDRAAARILVERRDAKTVYEAVGAIVGDGVDVIEDSADYQYTRRALAKIAKRAAQVPGQLSDEERRSWEAFMDRELKRPK